MTAPSASRVDQLPGPQILRADPVDRADRTTEHVVAAAELADLLDRRDVLRLLDHADDRRVAARGRGRSGTRLPRPRCRSPAEPDPLDDLDQHRRKPADVRRVVASRWNAMRCAPFGPTPGSRPSSSMRLWTTLRTRVPAAAGHAPGRRAAGAGRRRRRAGQARGPRARRDAPAGRADRRARSPPSAPRPGASGPIFSCCSRRGAVRVADRRQHEVERCVCAVSAGSAGRWRPGRLMRSTRSTLPVDVGRHQPAARRCLPLPRRPVPAARHELVLHLLRRGEQLLHVDLATRIHCCPHSVPSARAFAGRWTPARPARSGPGSPGLSLRA